MTYKEIQDEVIQQYAVVISDGVGCWRRTHAHVKERKVCKWHQANSIQSTFTLLHEVGHIETKTSQMRRVESEYHATVWAIQKCREYGILSKVPMGTRKLYQDYINRELDRGKRRGGTGYNPNGYNLDWRENV